MITIILKQLIISWSLQQNHGIPESQTILTTKNNDYNFQGLILTKTIIRLFIGTKKLRKK